MIVIYKDSISIAIFDDDVCNSLQLAMSVKLASQVLASHFFMEYYVASAIVLEY